MKSNIFENFQEMYKTRKPIFQLKNKKFNLISFLWQLNVPVIHILKHFNFSLIRFLCPVLSFQINFEFLKNMTLYIHHFHSSSHLNDAINYDLVENNSSYRLPLTSQCPARAFGTSARRVHHHPRQRPRAATCCSFRRGQRSREEDQTPPKL